MFSLSDLLFAMAFLLMVISIHLSDRKKSEHLFLLGVILFLGGLIFPFLILFTTDTTCELKAYSNGNYFKLTDDYVKVKVISESEERVNEEVYSVDEVDVVESIDDNSKIKKLFKNADGYKYRIYLEINEYERFIEETVAGNKSSKE